MRTVKNSSKEGCFRNKISAILMVFFSFFGPWINMLGAPEITSAKDELALVAVEIRYEKLMKLYLNKIKLAFSEPEDARLLAILQQFQPEFNQKAENLKTELQQLVKTMDPAGKAKVYTRLTQYSHVDELIALLFDERITSRQETNPEIKRLMEELQAKSLEIPKPE